MIVTEIRFNKGLCLFGLLLALVMTILAYVGILLVLGTMCIEFDTLWTTLQIPSNHRNASVSHVLRELAHTLGSIRPYLGMLIFSVFLACFSLWSFVKLWAATPAIKKE